MYKCLRLFTSKLNKVLSDQQLSLITQQAMVASNLCLKTQRYLENIHHICHLIHMSTLALMENNGRINPLGSSSVPKTTSTWKPGLAFDCFCLSTPLNRVQMWFCRWCNSLTGPPSRSNIRFEIEILSGMSQNCATRTWNFLGLLSNTFKKITTGFNYIFTVTGERHMV